MKSWLLLLVAVAAVSALPAKKTDYDDSEESFFLFPMGRQNKKEVPSVVEVEVGDSDEDAAFFPSYFRPLFINPFSFMNFGFSDFFSRPSWFESLVPKGIPEEAVKNSTSSTKVIDGHKITVNETTYENEKNGAVFRFKIIDISPVDSKEGGEKPAVTGDNVPDVSTEKEIAETPVTRTEAEDIKPDQNSEDNEIHKEEMFERYELQGDDPSAYDNRVEVLPNNDQLQRRPGVVDLSSDVRVNQLLAENARRGGLFMVPPEVEVFDTLDYDDLSAKYQQQPVNHQEVVRPQYNKESVQSQYNQQVVQPQYNQEIVQPHYNQQVVQPQYNQQMPPAQYNQQLSPSHFNQQPYPSQYNQQMSSQYNQQIIPTQNNQQAYPLQYNQQTIRPQYNPQNL